MKNGSSIKDGSPIPSWLCSTPAEVVRAYLDGWLNANGIWFTSAWTFRDDRNFNHGIGTCGYTDGKDWVAAIGLTGRRMLLPDVVESQ